MTRGRIALAAVVVTLLLPAAAWAHPDLVVEPPYAGTVAAHGPSLVVLRFNEPVTPVGSGIRVTGPRGRDASSGPVHRDGATLLRPVDTREHGTYVVEWRVVGDDTHPARGAFLFSVGERTRAALPGDAGAGLWLQALGRWLSFAGLALGFGVPFAAALSGGMTPRLWRLVTAGIVLALVAEPVALLGQTATLAPSRALDPQLAGDVLLTSYGHTAGLRVGAALGLWALAGAVRQASPRALWAIPVLGVAAATVAALSSHRIAGIPAPLSLAVTTAHVAAAGAWLGCVAVAVAEARGRALARTGALVAIVLVLTGARLAFGQLGSVGDLVETSYGVALSVKLALVAVALALGACALRRAELAAGLAALAAAAVVVSLLPPV
jgi:copper transport protein